MAHLLDDDLGEPLAPARVNIGSAQGPETAVRPSAVEGLETAG
jgi:hypothetical protein